MWFERAGIAASVVNLAKRATGPEYASSCKLVGRHTHLAHVDLVLFEFAINLGQGACVAAGAELELAELKGKLGAFEEQLGSCFSTLESLQAQTSTLPAMKSLLADLVKASAKNGAADVSC